MSENTQAQVSGTTVESEEQDKAPATVYATKAEAEAAWKPTGKYRVFEVAKDSDVMGYVWARGYDNALAKYARGQGYSSAASSSKAVTKEGMVAALEAMSAEERAEFLKAYLPAPVPAKPAKGGKK
jgi:hypothetical protein